MVVAPRHCHVPAPLQDGERWWGCTIQLYALRSSRNWGIGDFGDLRRLCDAAAYQGASFIGLSPLHALFPHNPAAASPYSPSSRKALNPLYLDVQTLVDLSGCEEAARRVESESFQDRLEQLRQAEVDWAARFGVVHEVLATLRARHEGTAAGSVRPELRWAWSQVVRSGGAVRVDTLAEEIGWSRRHLTEVFRAEFGVSPSTARRLARFEVATGLLRDDRPRSLSEVAAHAGYADQSHLSREWVRLAGASPTAWRSEEEFPSVHDDVPLPVAG